MQLVTDSELVVEDEEDEEVEEEAARAPTEASAEEEGVHKRILFLILARWQWGEVDCGEEGAGNRTLAHQGVVGGEGTGVVSEDEDVDRARTRHRLEVEEAVQEAGIRTLASTGQVGGSGVSEEDVGRAQTEAEEALNGKSDFFRFSRTRVLLLVIVLLSKNSSLLRFQKKIRRK